MYFGHKSCINRNKSEINPFWYFTYLAHPNYIVSSFYLNPFMVHHSGGIPVGRVFPELLYYGLISSKLVSEGDY